ncbi:MAG: DNA adenine methylase [Myxococcota bacterium]
MPQTKAPQPIPYQGSKRQQVPLILGCVPGSVGTLWEPFAGSGAVTIGAAMARAADAHVLGDALEPLVGIWHMILSDPKTLCDEYEHIWTSQLADPRRYYDQLRETYNREHRPAQLLYLVARCVKNAVRFNAGGEFNQSPDKRRLGMKPVLMRERVMHVHRLLAGRTRAVHGDYGEALAQAQRCDVVYMDPPYVGVSGTRDARYVQGLDYDRFVANLSDANDRELSYMVSFDGRCGERTYGPGLPEHLRLDKIDVHMGRSSQATLNGRTDETVESLYLSPALVDRLAKEGRSVVRAASVKTRVAPAGQFEMFGA